MQTTLKLSLIFLTSIHAWQAKADENRVICVYDNSSLYTAIKIAESKSRMKAIRISKAFEYNNKLCATVTFRRTKD